MTYNITDLMAWNDRIEKLAREMGLDFYPQEFDIANYEDMIAYMGYIGMPSHYPHWRYGKEIERTKTLHKYNLTGLPYEMVINSDPCLAYLMKDNTLVLQILTIAHVYGHNDFFKNNRLFKQGTRAEYVIEMFKNHADRVRSYIEDPSIGYQKVERILDAAHALENQTNRVIGEKRIPYEEQRKRLLENRSNPLDEYRLLRSKNEKNEEKPVVIKTPPSPEENLLYFLSQFAPLEDWERDLIDIVAEEYRYFLPQIETKIMNEGWASFWHYTLVNQLNLEQGLHIEFLKRHNGVVVPVPGRLNPYYLGFMIFHELEKQFGRDKIFEVRELERDQSFIRRYLTFDLCKDMNLFQFQKKGSEYFVSEVADEEGWKEIRNTLAMSVGTGGVPVVKVTEMVKKENLIILEHEYDGRELELNFAQKTLIYFQEIWGGKVKLLTKVDGKDRLIICDENKKISFS